MKLENIGFYTLSDKRAKTSSVTSPLYRCELLLTDKCNFKCPYCRKLKDGKDLLFIEAKRILSYWISEGLKNIRFSGGEPTLYKNLIELVHIAKAGKVEHIAISTNGSGSPDLYNSLINAGVNDFSISLDACCSSTGDTMSGKKGQWEKVIKNIGLISHLSYVTVGIVLNKDNRSETIRIIELAHNLGVSDIRVISSAQSNKPLNLLLPNMILKKHPILKYRVTKNHRVRGMKSSDCRKCKLVLDDMAVWNGEHYPCIIYLRENGKPIGKINNNTRQDRKRWYEDHNSWNDTICRKNCLDVCIQFNNTASKP